MNVKIIQTKLKHLVHYWILSPYYNIFRKHRKIYKSIYIESLETITKVFLYQIFQGLL